MLINYKNKNYNLYSLVIKEAEKMYVLPVLSKMEKWRLKAKIKINFNKYGAAYLLVPRGKSNVERYKLEQNTNYYIC